MCKTEISARFLNLLCEPADSCLPLHVFSSIDTETFRHSLVNREKETTVRTISGCQKMQKGICLSLNWIVIYVAVLCACKYGKLKFGFLGL